MCPDLPTCIFLHVRRINNNSLVNIKMLMIYVVYTVPGATGTFLPQNSTVSFRKELGIQ